MVLHESSESLSSTINPDLGEAIPVPAQACLCINAQGRVCMHMLEALSRRLVYAQTKQVLTCLTSSVDYLIISTTCNSPFPDTHTCIL